jgi:hypothetical protein
MSQQPADLRSFEFHSAEAGRALLRARLPPEGRAYSPRDPLAFLGAEFQPIYFIGCGIGEGYFAE